jgi:hypothetical protein
LNGHAEDHALENAWLDESFEAAELFFAFETEGLLNFLVLGQDFGMIGVTISVQTREDLEGLLPPVFGSKPSGTVWEEEQADEKNGGRHYLDAPGNPESGSWLVLISGPPSNSFRGAVLDEELSHC